jgi:hypothetical protein
LPDDGIDFDMFIARIEREVIRKALERTGGNKGGRGAGPQSEAHNPR